MSGPNCSSCGVAVTVLVVLVHVGRRGRVEWGLCRKCYGQGVNQEPTRERQPTP